jgi:kinesin family protein 1
LPCVATEKERGAKLIVQMKGTQTVLTPPPGAEKVGKGGGGKDHGPKVFNFDKSYWSFSKNDPTYGV